MLPSPVSLLLSSPLFPSPLLSLFPSPLPCPSFPPLSSPLSLLPSPALPSPAPTLLLHLSISGWLGCGLLDREEHHWKIFDCLIRFNLDAVQCSAAQRHMMSDVDTCHTIKKGWNEGSELEKKNGRNKGEKEEKEG